MRAGEPTGRCWARCPRGAGGGLQFGAGEAGRPKPASACATGSVFSFSARAELLGVVPPVGLLACCSGPTAVPDGPRPTSFSPSRARLRCYVRNSSEKARGSTRRPGSRRARAPGRQRGGEGLGPQRPGGLGARQRGDGVRDWCSALACRGGRGTGRETFPSVMRIRAPRPARRSASAVKPRCCRCCWRRCTPKKDDKQTSALRLLSPCLPA